MDVLTSRLIRKLPNGKIVVTCVYCSRSGIHPATPLTRETCRICKGRGEFVTRPGAMANQCRRCGGSGIDPTTPSTKIECNQCRGIGAYGAIDQTNGSDAEDGAPPEPLPYIHDAISAVSESLYRDGHYKNAALEAYIRVMNEVKERSGISLDGDKLMNQVFGCSGDHMPILRFNDLATEAERDEQQGIMYLFKGIVGLRNTKAHSNRLFTDPDRGYGYLALASLLLRLLEIAEKDAGTVSPQR